MIKNTSGVLGSEKYISLNQNNSTDYLLTLICYHTERQIELLKPN